MSLIYFSFLNSNTIVYYIMDVDLTSSHWSLCPRSQGSLLIELSRNTTSLGILQEKIALMRDTNQTMTNFQNISNLKRATTFKLNSKLVHNFNKSIIIITIFLLYIQSFFSMC